MAQRLFTLILLAWLVCLLPPPFAHASLFGNPHGNQFIPVDQAFRFDFRQQIRLVPVNATLSTFTLPAGSRHHDEFYGDIAVYCDDTTDYADAGA